MRKKKRYQAVALLTAFACALNGPLCAGTAKTAYAAETGKEEQTWKKDAGAGEAIAQENIIKLLSVADLEVLAQECALDQWSVGKHVVLEADLDLTDSDFVCIPTFGGSFDGNGHTISGYSMTKSGDVNGFFRYVQEGAEIKNLAVSGEVAPDGHRDVTGGLAGSNRGTVSSCSFVGTVKGKNRTGGIVGINEAQGRIYNCSFDGDVTGEHYAGGIVGENLGSVVRCKNAGAVNITEVKVSTEISEFGLEMLWQADAVSNVPASTDVGGIAGVSSGILQSCENTGDVGYPHTGYNVGGIVGRQSGYLDGCVNRGTVNGRKDVGGIVGQFEPEVTLQFQPDMLADLFTELEVMQGLIDTTIQDAKGVSSLVSGSMQGLSDSTKAVKSATQGLSDSMIDWADENLEAINDFSARLSWAIDRMVPAADALAESMDSMGDAAGLLSDALKDGKLMMESGSDFAEGASASVKALAEAIESAKEAADSINAALNRLGEAIGNDADMQDGIRQLGAGFEKLGKSLKDVKSKILKFIDDRQIEGENKARLEAMANAYGALGSALEVLGSILKRAAVENGRLTGADGLTDAADKVAKAAMELQIAGGASGGSLAAEENGNSTEAIDAYAQVQKSMTELGEMLDEVSTLFEEWEKAKEDASDSDAGAEKGADETKAAILEKLDLIQEKAKDIESALDALENAVGNESLDRSLSSAVKEAREQLERIVRTASELAERLEESPAGKEGLTEEDGITGDSGDSKDTAESREEAGNQEEGAAGTGSESETDGEGEEGTVGKVDGEKEAGDKSEADAGSEAGSGKEADAGNEAEGRKEADAGNEAGNGKEADAENEAEGRKEADAKSEAGAVGKMDGEKEADAKSKAEGRKEADTESRTGGETGAYDEMGARAEEEAKDSADGGDGVYYARERVGEKQNTSPEEEETDWDQALDDIQRDWEKAKQSLSLAFEKLLKSMGSIGDSLGDLAEMGSHAAETMGTLSKASAKMKDSFRSLSSASGTIRDTLSGLAAQPAVQFTPMDSRITAHKDALDIAMDNMTAQIDQLNSTMTVSSDVMLEDMEAINRQFGVIIRVLKQSNEKETEEIEDRIVDISDEEVAGERTDGCVTGSVNEGEICGDVNVAGIVGSMAIEYDFDPEDDLNKTGERSTDFSWLTSAVLSGCKNNGAVTAKKDCAGGIVGRMDMGRVSDCESYGAVTSTGGSYVGGIAGASYAAVRDSWAKCSLSGADYIGGIAGLGTTITNCHTLVEITESSAFTGTIAGKLQGDGELLGNTYVHTRLAAVDGISYAGQAEPVQYDELLSDSLAPEKFKEFELTFTADGEVVSVVKFQYGKGIKSLPEIPAKEGYSAKWPDLDYSCLTFSQTVEAEYTAYESALSAGGEIPVLLVDGSFSSEAVIEDETQELTFTDAKGREHTGTAVTVRVKDPVLEEITYTVHYRLPEEGKRYRLWVRTPDGWEKRDYEKDGNYLLLRNEGEEVTFLLEASSVPWGMAAALAVAAAFLIVVILRMKKRKKRNKG